MVAIKQIAVFGLLMSIVACAPRSYVVIPAGRSSVLSGSRDYSQTPRSLDASNSAPAKVPSPEDKLEKSEAVKKQSSSTASAVDFAAAIDSPSGSRTDVAVIDPDRAPLEENLAPLSNSFIGNETEHIKFARYDPFGAKGYFVVELDGLDYCYPIAGKYSSGYGRRGRSMHSGVDLVAAAGTPIYAIFDGTVRLSKPYSGYGNVIVLRHDNGLETVYAHNSRNMVRVGQKVSRGEQIAACGRTGRASTNHLHFEVRIQGATINPLLLIDAQSRKLQSGVLRVTRSSSGAIAAKRAANQNELVLADNASKAEAKPAANTATTTTTTGTAITSAAVVADGIIMQKEAAKPNVSRGMRVGDQVYEAPKTAASTSSANDNASYHKVAYGETMSAIARKYKTSVSSICKLNSIPSDRADKIKEGQKLRVK